MKPARLRRDRLGTRVHSEQLTHPQHVRPHHDRRKFRAALRKASFRPFVIHLADGQQVDIRHPEQVAIHPLGRTAVVINADESWQAVDLLLVTSLEFGQEQAA